jgi:hypothetical protein
VCIRVKGVLRELLGLVDRGGRYARSRGLSLCPGSLKRARQQSEHDEDTVGMTHDGSFTAMLSVLRYPAHVQASPAG